jgi:hypothetical protein
MKHGSRTRLMALPSHSARMAIEASPAPRKMALLRNNSTITAFVPKMIRG